MTTYVIKESRKKGKKLKDLTEKEKNELIIKTIETIESVLRICEILAEEKKAIKEAKKHQKALFNLIIKNEKLKGGNMEKEIRFKQINLERVSNGWIVTIEAFMVKDNDDFKQKYYRPTLGAAMQTIATFVYQPHNAVRGIFVSSDFEGTGYLCLGVEDDMGEEFEKLYKTDKKGGFISKKNK